MCANKVTPPKWSPQLFKIKENLLCPGKESVLTFCWILGPCWSQLITADQMWTWLSRGALRHSRRHDPCSDHSNQQLFEVHSHSTVHDCSVTFCGKYIPLSLPNLPMEVSCPGKLTLFRGFVTIHAWPRWIHSAYGAHHLSPSLSDSTGPTGLFKRYRR